jgi:hypothetical protein
MSAEPNFHVVETTREQTQPTNDIQATSDRRAVIEQTKGMVMLAYAIDAESALDLLRRSSRWHNLDLYDLASQLRDDFVQLSEAESPFDPLTVDCLLFTAHTRLALRHTQA